MLPDSSDGKSDRLSANEHNPYAAPLWQEQPIDLTTPAGWQGFPVLLWVAILAHAVFTVVLLRSTADDAKGGRIFGVLAVILIATGIRCSIRLYGCVRVAALGAGGQVIVCIVMLAMDIGTPRTVVEINAGIAAGFLLLTLWYQFRKHIPLPAWPHQNASSGDLLQL